MPNEIRIQVASKELVLLAQCGVFSPEERALFVADPHFGKDATFRRGGIPVPLGSAAGTLKKIREMLLHTHAEQLVILGDMFHTRSSLPGDASDRLDCFFDEHPGLATTLVLGNHDLHTGRLPERWSIRVVEEGTKMGVISLAHHPCRPKDETELVLCGHLHPAVSVGNRSESAGRLPCYWLSQRCLVLPAIGQFTGTHRIKPIPGDQIWLVADDQVMRHPMPKQTARTK